MRILRIIPGVLALSSAVLSVVTLCQGRSASPEISTLLQRRGPIEIWQNKKMSLIQEPTASKESPLVVQARIYADLLNPSKSKPVPETQSTAIVVSASRLRVIENRPRVQAAPQKVSADFKVHATSVFSKHPEKSMALISEPGKGFSWVRLGDMLGYLKVIEIRKDAVVYIFDETIDEVAWEPSTGTLPSRPKTTSSALAMNMPSATASPTPWPPVPATRLSNRLANPVNKRMHAISPRPTRGGR